MNYTSDQLVSFPWIVSTDTLRTEDLLVSYWSAAVQIGADFSAVIPALEQLVGEDATESGWDDEMAEGCLLQLVDILQDAAPLGFYFGSQEGDGACFGFWLSEDWASAMEHLGLGDDDPRGWACLIAELDADGLDADNIEDAYQGRAEGWSEDQAGADYAQRLVDEIGETSDLASRWPYTCIDWGEAWRELAMGGGYRLHDIGGGDYLVFRNV